MLQLNACGGVAIMNHLFPGAPLAQQSNSIADDTATELKINMNGKAAPPAYRHSLPDDKQTAQGGPASVRWRLIVYTTQHCENCDFARKVAQMIRTTYSHVHVQVIDIEASEEPTPDEVFATPTYLLNNKVWSLGNPSCEKIEATFGPAA
jgi:hypothetical protein